MTFMPYRTLTDNAPIHPGRPAPSNRQIFRQVKSPICEWNPAARKLAMLADRYHALALIELVGGHSLRLCDDCAREFPHRMKRAL